MSFLAGSLLGFIIVFVVGWMLFAYAEVKGYVDKSIKERIGEITKLRRQRYNSSRKKNTRKQ